MTSTPESAPDSPAFALVDPAVTVGLATDQGVSVEATDSAVAVGLATDQVVAVEAIDQAIAVGLATAALAEITPPAAVGELADSAVNGDGVLTLRFVNRQAGYPGWFWTVSLAQVADSEPTVLEVELLPGEGSLTAPDWVPWAERLADYQAAQAALAAVGIVSDDLDEDDDSDDESDEDLDDVDDLDAEDFDSDGSPILHSGDVDGVDIDELDEDTEDADEDADESDADDFSDEDAADDDEADDLDEEAEQSR